MNRHNRAQGTVHFVRSNVHPAQAKIYFILVYQNKINYGIVYL
ncbi:hypothetical protein BRYFOR_06834 [Marvinbryantia formatexigens DSM 14469]|uniref:Uncharacterized protein n=1 Tax=Marvinbryantia formatexigens DSM 14469 TaxID=478749 RepID=C6LDY5_9FIRM|nr:hypothetical protein BRYFOR_06834 [Marvinbryantia formatexigens DSM 14469]